MTATALPSLDALDITSEAIYDTHGYPWAEWDRMRAEDPVHWYQRPGYEPFWSLTGYHEIAWVARNPELFSCRERVAIETPDEVDSWETERERRGQVYGHRADHAPGLGFMDAPLHRHLRQVMYPCFTPKALALQEQRLSTLAKSYVDDFVDVLDRDGVADVAHQLSARLPLAAIFDILGVPESDWDNLFTLHQATAAAFHKDFAHQDGEDAMATFLRAMMELDGYMSELVKKRMADGGGNGTDMLSRLAQATVNDEPLAFHDISYQLFNLLQAGNGTTRNAIAGGIKVLLENPDQLRLLVDNPDLIDSAVEEILRWTSVAVVMSRTATRDTELGGKLIRKGDTVATWFPAANRDPSVFPDPYRFDITRTPNKHFAFGGYGEHRCIGANLAKLELCVMFRALLPLLPQLRLHGESKLLILRLLMAEYVQLPVRRETP